MNDRRAVIYPDSKRIACVLLQAVYGGDSSPVYLFNEWATTPEDNPLQVSGTMDQWRTLAEKWNKHHAERKVADAK